VGNVAPSGSTTVYPTSTTRYQLTANGSSLLSEVTIDVYEPKQQAQVVAPQPVISAPQPSKPSGPDAAALAPALGAYKSVFAHATGKACKGTLTGAFGGKLSAWARWCDEAKGFDVAEQCGGVGGSPDSPTLSCAETLTIHLKDGGDSPTHAQRVFHFSKGGDGSWQVTGW